MNRGKILVVDDELNIRNLIENEFSAEGFEVVTANTGEDGLKLFDEEKFHVMLLDIRLPRMSGIEVLKKLKKKYPSAEVIMFTAYGDIATAVECMKLGARDYVTKPFKLSELLALVKIAAGESHPTGGSPAQPSAADEDARFIQCPSPAMQEVYRLARRVAPYDKTVLIQGETGVGKDVVARLIHLHSRRKDKAFVILDCGMLNHNLAESELYGHCKGAFSGASEKKVGLVEESHLGTLFLDEVGNIDLELQKKLLRFLETGWFRRVGEPKETKVDTRIILATNLDLENAITEGTMRKDLFYRMDMICIKIPPLRERPEDVAPLAGHFLKLDGYGGPAKRLTAESVDILSNYQWPGNVRELRSVINKAMIFADSDSIAPSDLPEHVMAGDKILTARSKSLDDVEKEHITAVLAQSGGNQSKAAHILGINRKTLYKKLHKYQIE